MPTHENIFKRTLLFPLYFYAVVKSYGVNSFWGILGLRACLPIRPHCALSPAALPQQPTCKRLEQFVSGLFHLLLFALDRCDTSQKTVDCAAVGQQNHPSETKGIGLHNLRVRGRLSGT
jgi:hypothetical protein